MKLQRYDVPDGFDYLVEKYEDGGYYLASEVDAHLASLVKDAARYRWLRDKNAYIPEEQGVTGGKWLDELCDEHLTSKAGV